MAVHGPSYGRIWTLIWPYIGYWTLIWPYMDPHMAVHGPSHGRTVHGTGRTVHGTGRTVHGTGRDVPGMAPDGTYLAWHRTVHWAWTDVPWAWTGVLWQRRCVTRDCVLAGSSAVLEYALTAVLSVQGRTGRPEAAAGMDGSVVGIGVWNH